MTDVIITRVQSPKFFANLFQQIDALPQVLQDLIHEYNVDHRPQMNRVCKELLMAYQYRMFRFTFDYHRCYGTDCENVYHDCVDVAPYKITKYLGHCYVFCSSECEWDVMYDVRKSHSRCIGLDSPYHKYSTKIKAYLCFLPDCHCYNCKDYKYFEKARREGTLNEFDMDDDQDYPDEFPENDPPTNE